MRTKFLNIKDSSFKHRIIKYSSQFRFHETYSAIILRYRIYNLKSYLYKLGIECKLIQQYRSKKTAHRWSTAYQIVKGGVNLGDLRRLKNGMDADGNIWYEEGWDAGGSDNECAAISKSILDNAIRLGQSKMHYAEEGYESDDPRRKPNTKSIPVSRHAASKGGKASISSHLPLFRQGHEYGSPGFLRTTPGSAINPGHREGQNPMSFGLMECLPIMDQVH